MKAYSLHSLSKFIIKIYTYIYIYYIDIYVVFQSLLRVRLSDLYAFSQLYPQNT